MELAEHDLASLLWDLGDAVVVADAEGVITYWNPAAERIFGWSPAEAQGRPLDLIVPERLRQRHWDGYRNVMKTGETRYGADLLQVPAIGRDNRPLSIAFSVSLLAGPDGRPRGIAAVIRDETQRFVDERALRRRITELEAAAAT